MYRVSSILFFFFAYSFAFWHFCFRKVGSELNDLNCFCPVEFVQSVKCVGIM